jgi:integrase
LRLILVAGAARSVSPQPTGVKSWAVRYRLNGRPAKFTLGQYPAVPLAEARRKATEALARVAKGDDPSTERREAREAAEREQHIVARLAALFIEQHCRRKTRISTATQATGIFNREVLPIWGRRPIESIRRRDIADLVNAIAETRPIMANRTLAHLSKFFKFCVARDWLDASPCVGIERPSKETARSRCLDDDEIRRFWVACDGLPKPYGDIFQLLLLSGAPRQEVADMKWCELDLSRGLWTLPAERNKADVVLVRPLGPQAWSIIAKQPRTPGRVFISCRSGLWKAKRQLDQTMRPTSPWVAHDLRRTSRSLLSRAGVDSDVAEMLLGHALPGMRQIYDRFDYLQPKTIAYEKLESALSLILNPPADNVRPLRRRG